MSNESKRDTKIGAMFDNENDSATKRTNYFKMSMLNRGGYNDNARTGWDDDNKESSFKAKNETIFGSKRNIFGSQAYNAKTDESQTPIFKRYFNQSESENVSYSESNY